MVADGLAMRGSAYVLGQLLDRLEEVFPDQDSLRKPKMLIVRLVKHDYGKAGIEQF